MSYQLLAISPEGHRIKMGFGQDRAEHALDDRDDLRSAYARHKEFGWTVVVEDADGRVVEWADVETDVAAGEAA